MNVQVDRRQRQDDWHCGPVVAAVILDLCGFPEAESTERVARGLPVCYLDGVDPRTLESFLWAQGVKCQSGSMVVADLAHHTRHGRPVACLINEHGGHWVVVTRTSRNCVFFHDPLAGQRMMGKRKFAEIWLDTDRFGNRLVHFGIACVR